MGIGSVVVVVAAALSEEAAVSPTELSAPVVADLWKEKVVGRHSVVCVQPLFVVALLMAVSPWPRFQSPHFYDI